MLAGDIVRTFRLEKRVACTTPLVMQGKCQCQASSVECSDLRTIVPQSNPTRIFRLVVRDSNLVLNSNSFTNWNLTDVRLENCNLTDSSFNPNTFNSLADELRTLSLPNNGITKLPTALSKLTRLISLDVSDNPIDDQHFDENIMRDIGDTLQNFTFGGSALHKWPVALKHLPNLQELILTSGDISILPPRAFHGFEGTLYRLTIAHTNLRSVPLAIARLRYLQELHFDHNTNVGDYGVRIPIISGLLPYLYQMSLKDDNITEFPEVLKSFQKLSVLNMDENDLKFVSDKSASAVTHISDLSLKNSGITRVPGAIQDITNLNVLDLSNNSIHAIETNDLKECTELFILKLSHNPILYISDDAFANQTKLRRLEMRNVLLKKVPCAIEAMLRHHRLGHVIIDLSGNQIECNCGLRWLYQIINDGISASFNLVGNCDTINSSIQDYVKKQLSSCPAGVDCNDSI